MNAQTVSAAIKKHPLAAGSICASVLLLGFFYFRSSVSGELLATLSARMQTGERLTANVSHKVQLDEHLGALQEAVKAVDERLIQAGELAINLQYFYRIEAETGVKLVDLRQTGSGVPASPKSTYVAVPYAVTVQGSYRQILSFLKRIETGTYFARVVSATCTQGQTENEKSPPIALSLSLELLGKP